MAIERKPIRRGGIKAAGYDRANRILEIEFVFGHNLLEPLRRGGLVELTVTEATYAFARVTPGESVVVAFTLT